MFREAEEDESGFMCCAFSARERFLMLGTCTGQLKLYNVFSGQEEASYSCHSSAITHLEPSRVCESTTRSTFLSNPKLLNGSVLDVMNIKIILNLINLYKLNNLNCSLYSICSFRYHQFN